ncbi:hypothetical protein [Bacteroides sp. UBA939]|uniref:hypothetical protein n=1 Tax=Bacteroides sp. UBA939 TaxID=1946092 RepID=UPI0025C5D26D|nr:hypothetical protein [Bacteroides sp. UBA939]
MLVASSGTFDLIESVLVPSALEKAIPLVRKFSGIVISGVTGSSLLSQAATKGKRNSASSAR